MAREIVTRELLRRELAVNAATKPLAVAAGAGVAVAGLLLGAAWLLGVAAIVYAALAVATFLDGDEAAKVGRRAYERRSGAGKPADVAPETATLLDRARDERQRIVEALADAEVAMPEVVAEVDALTREMERIAARADRIDRYLAREDAAGARRRLAELRAASPATEAAARANERAAEALEQRLSVADALAADLGRFRAEMEHLIATLGVIHGHVVQIGVASGTTLREDVAAELRDLRERVGAIAASIGGAHDP